ncbi:MAG: ABC transporter substrate-binding protein [Burkholderiaceae bacterium]
MFDGLINQGATQDLRPGLAESWKPIDDLAQNSSCAAASGSTTARFNADDVVCTFKRAPDVPAPRAVSGLYTKRSKTVVKVDDYTVHIKTTRASLPLVANDVSTIAIVSDGAGCGASTDDFNKGKAAVGTGPWKFVEYVPGDRIVLDHNDGYWGDKPEFSRAILKPIKSDPARVAALLAGDVDLINDVPDRRWQAQKRAQGLDQRGPVQTG